MARTSGSERRMGRFRAGSGDSMWMVRIPAAPGGGLRNSGGGGPIRKHSQPGKSAGKPLDGGDPEVHPVHGVELAGLGGRFKEGGETAVEQAEDGEADCR